MCLSWFGLTASFRHASDSGQAFQNWAPGSSVPHRWHFPRLLVRTMLYMYHVLRGTECVAAYSRVIHHHFSLPHLEGTGGESTMKKGSGVKIRTGKSLTSYWHGKNRLSVERLI